MSLPYWSGGPVWDDHNLIVAHLAALSPAEVAALWWSPVGLGETGAAYYRPLAMVLLSMLGRIGIPLVHLVVAGLHAASAALLVELGGRSRAALVGALVFAAHPAVWEVLGWASALPDALALFAGLSMLRALQLKRPAVAALMAAVGVASKETALVWLVVAAIGGRTDRRGLGWLAIGGGGVLALRLVAGVDGTPPVGEVSLAHLVEVLAHQLGTLVWPHPLSPVRDTHHLAWWRSLLGFGVVLALLGSAWRGDRWRRALGLGVALPLLFAAPTVMSAHLAGDRYLYSSLAAVALMLGGAPFPRRSVSAAMLGVGAMIWTAHLDGASAWRSDRALFQQAVDAQPESAYAHHFLGHAHAMSGEWSLAAASFDDARARDHSHPLSAQLALQAHVLAGEADAAIGIGRSGPRDGLTAEWIAWWARAELLAGNRAEAAKLVSMLERADGSFDGPDFVPGLSLEIVASP